MSKFGRKSRSRIIAGAAGVCLLGLALGHFGCRADLVSPPVSFSSMVWNAVSTGSPSALWAEEHGLPEIGPDSIPETDRFAADPYRFAADPMVSRSTWNFSGNARDWKYIVLHHTASESGSVESIHAIHLKNKDAGGKPWLGIGYHFVIGNGRGMGDGEVESTFRWRGQLAGAHAGVADYNQRGIGIVLVGNFQQHPPTPRQVAAVKQLVAGLRQSFGIRSEDILGHGNVKATECPGRHFPMADVRQSLARIQDGGPIHDLPSFALDARWQRPMVAGRDL